MSIGILGIVVVIISLFFIGKPIKLLYAAIFFAPFCASSVISFTSFFLQPGHYFMFFYIGISLLMILTQKKGRLDLGVISNSNRALFAFVCVAFLSILVSAIMKIDVQVYGVGTAGRMKSSLVSIQNFTQFLYLAMGYTMYLFVFQLSVNDKNRWFKILHIFAISGLVVLGIGVYQIIATRLDLPYDEIFRNSVKKMWQTKERVQATFGEASYLGQYCIYLLAIYGSFKWIQKKFYRIASIIFTAIIGIMSRSSTFLFGLAALLFSYFCYKKMDRKTILKYLVFCIISPIILWYLLSSNIYVQNIVTSAISKLNMESFSGIERLTIFNYTLRIGLKNPILGFGYGGGRSRDLYTNLFSNVGFVGLALFLFFILGNLIILIRNKEQEFGLTGIILIICFLVTSCANPDLSYLPIWVLFGLIDSRCSQIKKELI